MVDLEDLSDDELEKLQEQFRRLQQKARSDSKEALRAIADDLEYEVEADDEETVVTKKRKTS